MRLMKHRRFIKSTEGSFTLEASLVMPIVLFVTMILMFLCLYIYQQTMLHQVAAAVAERSAYSWDNSHKEASNGSFAKGEYDSLYWRLKDDNILGLLFGWAGAEKKETLGLPGQGGNSLPLIKMGKSGTMVTGDLQGNMSYQNALIQRKVSVDLQRPISLPPLDTIMNDGGKLDTEAGSIVVEPVEFIRTVDLMRYYGNKFKGSGDGGTNKGEAAEVLNKFK